MKNILITLVTSLLLIAPVQAQNTPSTTGVLTIQHLADKYQSSLSIDLSDPNVILEIQSEGINIINHSSVPVQQGLPEPELIPESEPELPQLFNENQGDVNRAIELTNQAQLLAYSEEYDQAMKLLTEAVNEAPKLAEAHAMQGSVLFKLGETAAAVTAWQTALQLDPSMHDVKNILNWLAK